MRLGIYQHFSGKQYQVLGIARHSETLEPMVVYQALYGDYGVWVRPEQMFHETIQVDGHARPRFMFLSENLTHPPHIHVT